VVKDFSLRNSVRTDLEVNAAFLPVLTGVNSSGIKRPRREADHSPPVAVVSNAWRGALFRTRVNTSSSFRYCTFPSFLMT
jgi:hypothetical protein